MFSMEKYAVIKLASKQYLVREGDVIELERQEKPLKIEVLFYSDGEKRTIGEPEVSGIVVKASVLEEKLGKKVRVARFKKKSRYERVRGHRQPISIVKIEKIGTGKEEGPKEDKASKQVIEKKSAESAKTKVTKEKLSTATVKKPVKKETTVKKETASKPASKLKGSK